METTATDRYVQPGLEKYNGQVCGYTLPGHSNVDGYDIAYESSRRGFTMDIGVADTVIIAPIAPILCISFRKTGNKM